VGDLCFVVREIEIESVRTNLNTPVTVVTDGFLDDALRFFWPRNGNHMTSRLVGRGMCLQRKEGSHRLRKRFGQNGERHNGRVQRGYSSTDYPSKASAITPHMDTPSIRTSH
jgi:hypothetical protein